MTKRREDQPRAAVALSAPQSIEAEDAVIGAVLIDQSALHDACQYVTDADFSSGKNRAIFRSMVRLDTRGTPVDLVTLVDDLRGAGELELVGGAVGIAEIGERVPTAAHAAAYARVVREKSIRRRVMRYSSELSARASEDSDLVGIHDVMSSMFTMDLSVEPVPTMQGMVAQTMRRIEETASGQRVSTIPTGLTDIDRMLGGIPIGWQAVLLARPRIGKSALARTIAHNALRRGETIGYVDLEMRRDGLIRALISRESGISSARLRRGQIEQHEWSSLVAASERVEKYPLLVHDGDNAWAKIKLIMRRWVDAGAKLIVIDYLSKIEPESHTGNMFIDVGKVVYESHDFAHKFDVSIILVVQQTRDAPKEKDKRPKLYHARESGRVEEAADLVFALYSPSEFDTNVDPALTECWVLKAKDAATGRVDLKFIPHTMEFADWDGEPNDERFGDGEYSEATQQASQFEIF